MKRKTFTLLFIFVSALAFAQHVYVVLGRVDGSGYEKFFACGDQLKLKLKNGEKERGRIDTVFADGMVLSGDSILFKDVKKFGYRYQNKQFLKNEFIASGVGLGIAGAFALISAINSGRYPPGADQVQTVAGASAVFILAAGPFFIDAVCKSACWQHRKMTKAYHLYGLMGN